jgi:predicted enzyme related to lactoylglutathione lyase
MTARIDNLMMVSADPERLARFYSEMPGCTELFRDGARFIQLAVGDRRLAICNEAEGGWPAPAALPVFRVEDIDACRGMLESAGGEVLAERDMGDHGRSLTIKDPGGHVFHLLQK